ncbi:MAG TPA: Stp1/IreP family PP2C-type Ser/Thr phosphatase [Phototrophicaceae bacterium]|nr:Stp1/IreP family PP2C-type Ser/Thr phosphatase [Phototrophicaceae bacterium]
MDDIYFVQDCGLAVDKGEVRENNEDSALSIGIGLADGDLRHAIGVYAVADGMGGHEHGEVASQIALHTAVREVIHSVTRADQFNGYQSRTWLERAVKLANQAVYRQNDTYNSSNDGMGSTLVLALVVDNCAHIASVGDSRAYRISSSGIQQVTNDHNVPQMLLQHGVITPEQALVHPYRNILSKAIGMEEGIQVDTFTTGLDEDSALLLCSDGLTGELDDWTIYEIVREANTPQLACDALVNAANEAGGHDNISAVLVQVKPIALTA